MTVVRFGLVLVLLLGCKMYATAQDDEAAQRRERMQRGLGVETLTDSTVVHDPVMIREGDTYYMFTTGWGISVFSSSDRKTWKREKPVFEEAPAWAVEAVPDFRGHVWAPDIAHYRGQYYLYYSVSSFGKNTSAIGVATTPTLDPESPEFGWTDHGAVIRSIPGVSNWNAIDANFILDEVGHPYLSFGSFWGGLMLARLQEDGLAIEGKPEDFTLMATRGTRENPIEAPFVFKHDNWYYLFASWDFCCRGSESTYKVVVGRSESLSGTFVDAEGRPMNQGGGTLVAAGGERYAGVGHNAVVHFDGTDYLVFHAYDLERDGRPYLRILPIRWEEGWPVVAKTF